MLIDANRLRASLPASRRDWDITTCDTTASTNADLLQALRETGGAPLPDDRQRLRQADFQTAGRGRLGRRWHGAPGDTLMFSLAWPMPRPLTGCGGVTLACGLAVVQALATLAPADAGARLRLKWPNDVELDGAKLAGILVESGPSDARASWLVIGVGLNLRADAAAEAAVGRPLASLAAWRAQAAASADATAVLAALAAALGDVLDSFGQTGFAPFAAPWNARDAHAGAAVEIAGEGAATLVGVARGCDDSGALLLQTADGMRRIQAGEMSLRAVRSET